MASGSRTVIFAALAGNFAIAITKGAAAALTGSSAMLSEAVHSVVDTANQGLLLLGLQRAARAPDARHPFGHGKEVYFWSFLVAILIFAVGAGVSLYEGAQHLLHPHPVENPAVNYVVLGLATLFEGAAWFMAWREFRRVQGPWSWFQAVRRGKDPSLFVVLFEDSAALLGLGVAFFGVWLGQLTGSPYWDGAASVVIGLILGVTAIWLAYETKGLLIGESAQPEVVEGIRAIARERELIEHVNEALTLHMGPEFILVNLSVDFRDSITADEMEREIGRLDAAIKSAWPRAKKVFVEAEARRILPARE